MGKAITITHSMLILGLVALWFVATFSIHSLQTNTETMQDQIANFTSTDFCWCWNVTQMQRGNGTVYGSFYVENIPSNLGVTCLPELMDMLMQEYSRSDENVHVLTKDLDVENGFFHSEIRIYNETESKNPFYTNFQIDLNPTQCVAWLPLIKKEGL